jgi:hypothetical protein
MEFEDLHKIAREQINKHINDGRQTINSLRDISHEMSIKAKLNGALININGIETPSWPRMSKER